MGSIVLLDGATGTELSRRGHDTRLPLWSARALLDAPEAIAEIHADYLRAGARVITTCTFRTHARNLAHAGLGHRADELNHTAVTMARRAIAASNVVARVAGSIASLEDCFRVDLVPSDDDLDREHTLQARSLADAGADLLLVETMGTIRESVAATAAAVKTGLPVWTSFLVRGALELYSGEPLAVAAARVASLGAEALLVNCLPAASCLEAVRALRAATSLPVGVYPNIGHADDVDGWHVELMLAPGDFAARMLACRDAGATILGGCCGTEPRHIAALSSVLGEPSPPPGERAG